MARVPIGLELYSVRNELADDLRGTLEAVAAMGYEGVEFAGPPQHTADELKPLLDELGLLCCGWHTPFDRVQEDTLAATIDLNLGMGNKYVIIPGIPGHLIQSREDWRKMADFFNALSEKLMPHGLRTGYHNHHVEFSELDGELPWDTFFGNTHKEVIMQLDVGNAMRGGGEVEGILKQYPGRASTVHLKPYSYTAGKDDPTAGFRPIIGEDEAPWEAIFNLCETTGETEWYIVEYESDAFPPLEAVERCLKALRAMGK